MIRAEPTLQQRAMAISFFALSRMESVKTSENPRPKGFFTSEKIAVAPTGYVLAKESVRIIPDRIKFQYFVARWREEYGVSSSTHEMVMSPSYQAIIGMGEKALPFIFEQLEREGENADNWFWALKSITQENPVPDEMRGDRPAMARAWLDWWRGARNGHILNNGR